MKKLTWNKKTREFVRSLDDETKREIGVLNIGDHIYIPHAFTKKSQKTPKKEINLSIKRLQELLNETK